LRRKISAVRMETVANAILEEKTTDPCHGFEPLQARHWRQRVWSRAGDLVFFLLGRASPRLAPDPNDASTIRLSVRRADQLPDESVQLFRKSAI